MHFISLVSFFKLFMRLQYEFFISHFPFLTPNTLLLFLYLKFIWFFSTNGCTMHRCLCMFICSLNTTCSVHRILPGYMTSGLTTCHWITSWNSFYWGDYFSHLLNSLAACSDLWSVEVSWLSPVCQNAYCCSLSSALVHTVMLVAVDVCCFW